VYAGTGRIERRRIENWHLSIPGNRSGTSGRCLATVTKEHASVEQRFAQDPDELFDVVDTFGAPTGVSKRRADIHRDGDWHRAIHVWVYGHDADGPFLLLQRRGLGKDTWPGMLDTTVGGHLAAGETPKDAFREVEEEIGVRPDLAALRHVGTRVIASEELPHTRDRELEEVYLLRDDRPLTAYRPERAEVDALVRVPLGDWIAFLFGERESVATDLLAAGDGSVARLTVTVDQLIPLPDRYYERVAIACQRALAGERYVVV
jgi:isopentenyldiphosphate isomerase